MKLAEGDKLLHSSIGNNIVNIATASQYVAFHPVLGQRVTVATVITLRS